MLPGSEHIFDGHLGQIRIAKHLLKLTLPDTRPFDHTAYLAGLKARDLKKTKPEEMLQKAPSAGTTVIGFFNCVCPKERPIIPILCRFSETEFLTIKEAWPIPLIKNVFTHLQSLVYFHHVMPIHATGKLKSTICTAKRPGLHSSMDCIDFLACHFVLTTH